MMAMTGLERRKEKIGPKVTLWEAPPKFSKERMRRMEPSLPPPSEEPLPLPLSLMGGFGGDGAREEGLVGNHGGPDSGGVCMPNNGEICLGKFVDPGPDSIDTNEKREDGSLDNISLKKSWTDLSLEDSSSLGPYDRVVRCWKCRAGLKVHMGVGLVVCPRCRTISPATDVANFE